MPAPRRLPPSARPFAPRRLRGVRPQRAFPAFPEPLPAAQVNVEDTIDMEYRRWEATWNGTFPEFLCFRWLTRRGMVFGTDFVYQSSRMGGRQMPGGAVVDFEFLRLRMVWRVQGERFHVGDPTTEARDEMQKLQLEMLHLTVVDIFAEDIVERTEYALSRAIQGEEITMLRGI